MNVDKVKSDFQFDTKKIVNSCLNVDAAVTIQFLFHDAIDLAANGKDYKNKIDLILARSKSLSDEEFNELYNLGIEAINKVSKSK